MNNNPLPIEIRTAIFDDIEIIQDIAHKTWPITYNNIISKRQIDFMLEMMYSEKSLQRQIFQGSTFIIAEDDNNPVGFAGFKELEHKIFKLDKLYILPNTHNKGVGKALLQEVIKRILEIGGEEIQLQVNRKNPAVGFYSKMGFDILREQDFNIGNDFYMKDYVMSLKL